MPLVRPERLNHQARQAAPGFHGVIGIFLTAFMLLLALGLRQRVWKTALFVVLPWPLWPIYGLTWGCSPEKRSRLYSEIKHPLCTISGGCAFGFFLQKQKKHTLTHFNEQELSCVHHARSAAAHGLPATPGAGVDEQRQPAA